MNPVVRSALLRDTTPAVRLGPAPGVTSGGPVPDEVTRLVNAPGAGDALDARVRSTLESSLDLDLSPVRVHAGPEAAAATATLGTRAFTYGVHVFLAEASLAADLGLMAHEVGHVVQQQGAPVLQRFGGGSGAFEGEAQRVSADVTSGRRATVVGRTGGAVVQGDNIFTRGARAIGRGIQRAVTWVADRAWDILGEFAPDLVPILRRGVEGVFDWIKDKVQSAVETVFEFLMRPVRTVEGAIEAVTTHFGEVLSWMRDAAAKIARGDCGPLSEAAQKIERVVTGIATPIINRIKAIADRVGGFFTGLWEKFGKKAWDWLVEAGGTALRRVRDFISWCWDRTAPIREMGARAWAWVKEKLGFGGEDSNNGILAWVQRKAEEAWTWVKQRIEPFKSRILAAAAVIAGVGVMLSPAGPIIAIGVLAAGLIRGVVWVRQHLNPRNVVGQRDFIRGTVIPTIMGAVNSVTAAVQRAARAVSSRIADVLSWFGRLAGAVAGTIVAFATRIIDWFAAKFRALADWALEKLGGLAEWVATGLERLRAFLQPVFDVLGQIANVIVNIMSLPFMLAGRLWNLIPACIRDPFVNFLVGVILRRIPIFREIGDTPEAWSQMAARVVAIVRMVFRNRDLMGAMRATFRLLLDVLKVPVDLAQTVLRKAANAWDAVLARPIAFLRNVLRAMRAGFGNFFTNILGHLGFGIQGWIFSELRDANINPPSSWTDLRAVFGFVMQVLGINEAHIFELLGRRLSPERVEQIRRIYRIASGAWEWVRVAMTEGPAGLWRMLVERLRTLGRVVLEAAINWIIDQIIVRVTVRLLTMLDPTGIMAVVNALVGLYRAIQTVVRYLRQILEIMNRVLDTILDIAAGNVGPGATMLEEAMHRAMPVIIAFLANQVGLSGLGARMREIVGAIRERVDQALLWLIDRAIQMGQAFMRMLGGGPRAGAGAVNANLDRRVPFLGESHTVRAHLDERNADILMASEPFKPIADTLELLVIHYASEHSGVFVTTGNTDAARELRETVGGFGRGGRQGTGILGRIQQYRIALRDTMNPIVNRINTAPGTAAEKERSIQQAWEREALDELEEIRQAVSDLGETMRTKYGSALGPGTQVQVNQLVHDLTQRQVVVVDAIGVINQVEAQPAAHFGVRASLGDRTGSRFLSYHTFNREWVTLAPHSHAPQVNVGSGPGDHTRTATIVFKRNQRGSMSLQLSAAQLAAYPDHNIRGHLIADVFDGPATWANIVPVTDTANGEPTGMLHYEMDLARTLMNYGEAQALGRPATTPVYAYSVTPTYANPNDPANRMPPTHIRLEANEIWPNTRPAIPAVTIRNVK